jgi:hypothetical protein
MTFIEFVQYLKYVTSGIFVALVIFKFISIEVYKAQSQDYIPRKIFSRYTYIEVHGTDITGRRKFMLRANRMTNWIYISMVFVLLARALPMVAKMLGIVGVGP